jgi:hypothetical protein
MPRPRRDLASQRVRLAAHARPLRRGPGQVQFGLDPTRGIVLDGLSEAEVGWLLTLTPAASSAALQTAGTLLGTALTWGVSAARASELVGLLHSHGLLHDPSPPTGGSAVSPAAHLGDHRRASLGQVCVVGAGGAASALRRHLLEVSEVSGSSVTGVVEDPAAADVTVLVVAEAVGTPAGPAGVGDDATAVHLPVVVQAHRVAVGPLVGAADGPCLTCLDYHRRDRDRAWPALMAQVDGAMPGLQQPVEVDPILAGLTLGLCTMVLHAYLGSGAVLTGLAWEVSLPWPHVLARQWPQHPACARHQRCGEL